jgi:ABC-type polysaccharide/polyol phosphate export permease
MTRAISAQMAGRRVWESGGDLTVSAVRDLREGLSRWQLWGLLGWQDVSLRYRRSLFGPFWLTISMGIMVMALGVIYSHILKVQSQDYLPFLTVGFLVWALIVGSVNEGCHTFIESEGLIRQLDVPLSLFPLRVAWRNLIIFLHNAAIYVVVVLVYDLWPGWTLLAALGGLAVLLLNTLWVSTLLGMLSARYRDIPQIAVSLLQIAFFITPIIWMPQVMSDRLLLVQANPFYHLIELVRAPMLGHLPSALTVQVALGFTTAGWLAAFLLFRRFHTRIAYWV